MEFADNRVRSAVVVAIDEVIDVVVACPLREDMLI